LAVRYGVWHAPATRVQSLLVVLAPIIGVVTMWQFGLYKFVTRHIGTRGAIRIPMAVVLSGLIWAVIVLLAQERSMPRTVIIVYPIVGSVLVWLSRELAARALVRLGRDLPQRLSGQMRNVVIYGAGDQGVQVLRALHGARGYAPIAFIDSDPQLVRRYIDGLRVHAPGQMAALIEREAVKDVILAIGHSRRAERREVLQILEPLGVRVRVLPRLFETTGGLSLFDDLQPVGADDILGREPVAPDPLLLSASTRGKTIMVTGAGGSVGSELVRQIMRQAPLRIVLYEMAEIALYQIERELRAHVQARRDAGVAMEWPIEIVPVLGSVLDRGLLDKTIRTYGVGTIYHAAAYKQVPLVEANPVIGVMNNTIGTLVCAEVAREAGVERFVLISTDKAVRATNVMGASKRVAELIIQGFASRADSKTVFCAVRFGNVLDSSGSVMRLFREQIEAGGPVTVTHPQMIRYFMSIPEAATLVMQAGALAKGGEIFLLDMGEPISIDRLARAMIHLMGRQVRDDQNPDGDIAIAYTGLRPGEKLREELQIGDAAIGTSHPSILECREPSVPMSVLSGELRKIIEAAPSNTPETVLSVLERLVEGYGQQRAIGDWASANRDGQTIH
jgi:FlaA1/EpsC-like NDP-sugar epimerase